MSALTTGIIAHPANHHMLWRYLKTHAEDERLWDRFATHLQRILARFPAALAILRARLPVEAQEVYDTMVESAPPTEMLVPADFHPRIFATTALLRDLEHLEEGIRFGDFHAQSLVAKPLPVALGVIYPLMVTPGWTDTMDLLIAPYTERMDLIALGIESALERRYRLWNALLADLTTDA